MPFAYSAAPAVLYRVGYLPDPFTRRLPRHGALKDDADPAGAHESGRFDDPAGHFATLYLASTPVTAFAETIHNFRAVRGLKARILAATDEDEPDDEFDLDILEGILPRAFTEPPPGEPQRTLATCRLSGNSTLVDVTQPLTHVELNAALGTTIVRLGQGGFDRGVVMNEDRRISRRVAGHLHSNAPEAVGILYESRFDPDGRCVALWERATLTDHQNTPITHEHPALREAAELLGITPEP